MTTVCHSYTVLTDPTQAQHQPRLHPMVIWSKIEEGRWVAKWLVTVNAEAVPTFEDVMHSLETSGIVLDWFQHVQP